MELTGFEGDSLVAGSAPDDEPAEPAAKRTHGKRGGNPNRPSVLRHFMPQFAEAFVRGSCGSLIHLCCCGH